MSEEDVINLELDIQAEYAEDERVFNEGTTLYNDLHESRDVETVKRVRIDSVPDGTKPGDPITIGTLAVAVLPTAVPSLIALVQAWITQGQGRTVKFKSKEFEFEGSPKEFEKFLSTIQKGKKKK